MAKSETPARDGVLVKYLNEAYGKEKQLETVLKAQIGRTQSDSLKKGFQEHLKVTKAQANGLKKRIRELGGKADTGTLPGPDAVGEAVTSIGNKAMAAAKGPVQALRGTSGPDNELRNIRDSLWNEAEEIAHYDVIEQVATELGDKDTVKLAKQYRREEEKMQTLLGRELKKAVKAVVKDEVPKEERPSTTTRRRSSSSSSSSSSRSSGSRSTSRSASSRSSSSRSSAKSSSNGSGSSSSGSTTSRRKPAAKKSSSSSSSSS